MKKVLFILAFICLAGLGFFAVNTQAAQLDLSMTSSDDSDGSELFDDDFNTGVDFAGGTTLTFKASEPISSLYIKWDAVPTATTLKDGDKEVTVGQNGFVHEFVPLSGSNSEATLTIPDGGIKIADVYAFSGDDLPDFVQKWNEPWDKADILFISTHSDDEVLFFGGMIPIYTNEHRARVQVAYFTDFFLTETYRVHEFLDGLWTMGVDHYPQFGKFYDNYSESLEEAEEQFDHDECLAFIVEVIRRFKPQVVVTHDIEGEYGHGGHRYVSKLVREAVEITGDETKESESVQKYGAWDVPKTYLHLYPENTIETDTRAPLSDFGGKCALDVAKEAYKKHLSQQWMWFYVDDGYDENGNPNDYQYSCAKYGLFRTTVGEDTGKNDVLENIVPYDVQEKQKAEEAAKETESTDAESVSVPDAQAENHGPSGVLVTILIILGLLVIAFFIFFGVAKSKQKKREALARRRRAQRAAEPGRPAQGGGQRPPVGSAPARDGAPSAGGQRPPYGSAPARGTAPSAGGQRPPYGNAPARGTAPGGGQRPPVGSAPARGGAPSAGGQRPPYGNAPARGTAPGGGQRPPYGNAPARGPVPGGGQRPPYGNAPARGPVPGGGQRPPVGSAPARGPAPGTNGQRPPYGNAPARGPVPGGGKRSPYGNAPARGPAPGGGQRPPVGSAPVRGTAPGTQTPPRRRPDGPGPAGPNNRNGNGRR